MWVFFTDSYLSVVDKSKKPGCLMVRARDRAHILAVFPGAKVRHTPESDYQYRADILREEVAKVISDRVMAVDYSNFKGAIKNNKFHDVCSRIWSVCTSLGRTRPYAGRSRNRNLFDDDFIYSDGPIR